MEPLSYDELLALVPQLQAQIAVLIEENAALKAEIERLKQTPSSPLPFVKASRPPASAPKPPRKKRKLNFARQRETPTREVEHKLSRCPDCEGPLSRGYEKRRRQVIEIPDTPVEVIDHVIYGHWCGFCRKVQVARPSPQAVGAIGKHRVGIRLMSLVATLHLEGRVPLRTIRTLLSLQYGVALSVGELSELLHAVAQAGVFEQAALLQALRAAPVACGDETSWREDGHNGYLWSFSTPDTSETPLRYFLYRKSRAGAVVTEALGDAFGGVLVSDFYGAYNVHLGFHQRCWVHFLRDLHELKKAHPDDLSVTTWAERIKKVYQRAKQWKPPRPGTRWEEPERREAQRRCEAALRRLARRYRAKPDAPQHTLAKRIEAFLPELFVFVKDPRVPSDNNGAERSVRPAVIARKISGGTRSEKGSETKTTLMTLFGTWKLQGKNLLEACCRMLLAAPLSSPLASLGDRLN